MKFNEQNLIKKLGFTKEEANFIEEVQKEIPILASEDAWVWGRTLHGQLEVATKYNDFINSQLQASNAKHCKDYFVYWVKDDVKIPCDSEDNSIIVTEENLEKFKTEKSQLFKKYAFGDIISQQQLNGAGFSLNHKLTIQKAKEIAMVVGATAKKQNTKDKSQRCREYFLLMEEAVKRVYEWEINRADNIKAYHKMKETYTKQYMKKHNGRKPQGWRYGRLQNNIYWIVFGVEKASSIKDVLEIKQYESIPANVVDKVEEALTFAYETMTFLMKMRTFDIDDRETLVYETEQMFDEEFGGVIKF